MRVHGRDDPLRRRAADPTGCEVAGTPAVAVGGVMIALTGITSVFLLSGGLLLAFSVMFVFVKSLWVLDGRANGAVSAVPQG